MELVKNTKNIRALCIVSILFVAGCMPKEIPVPKPDAGSIQNAVVEMGTTYKWQVYYDLETNRVVGQNLKTDWDLAFSKDNYIMLNSSKFMFAYCKNQAFESTDTTGFGVNKKCDVPSGNLDSIALSEWKNNPSCVIFIDRGFSENGVHQGCKKMQVLSISETAYTVRIADLNNINDTTLSVPKKTTHNYTFLNVKTNKIVAVEPEKSKWDIAFTTYTHIFYQPFMPYLVTGCLLNRHNTKALLYTPKSWEEINLDVVKNLSLQNNLNVIGYNWKKYNLSQGVFIVDSQKVYVIHTQEGYYYKLRFIDFYKDGVKGFPTFEVQRL